MARVALIKLFSGLNLGVAQLSGELQRAGHDSRVIFFKDYRVVAQDEAHLYLHPEFAGTWVAEKARVKCCNAFTPMTEKEFELLFQTLRDFAPDLIGFSLPSMPFREVAEVTRRVKQHFDVPVIWGGAEPTLEPARCLEHTDMVCVGEGEELIVELANAIDAGRDYSGIKGLWLKRNGEIIENPTGPMIELDRIAIPDYEPARVLRIEDDRIERNVAPSIVGLQYSIMTQRGCPYSCSFCIESVYQDMFGKKGSVRRRSVDLVIEELVLAKQKYGIKAVLFYDDVFTTHHPWLQEFAPRYKAEVDLPFWCYTYPRTTNKEIVLLLKDAGLTSMTMGIQSGSVKVLESYNRRMPNDRTIEAVQDVIDCGVTLFFDLMTRSEVETEETCRETFEFLLDLPHGAQTVGFYPMVKYPNYGYTLQVQEEQRRHSLTDADYDYFHRLYLLTRTKLPRQLVRALSRANLVRRHPRILNPLLQSKLPFFFLDQGSLESFDANFGNAAGGDSVAARASFAPPLPPGH